MLTRGKIDLLLNNQRKEQLREGSEFYGHVTAKELIETIKGLMDVLQQARVALETVTESLENCHGRETPETEAAREALQAIDELEV